MLRVSLPCDGLSVKKQAGRLTCFGDKGIFRPSHFRNNYLGGFKQRAIRLKGEEMGLLE